MRRLRVRPMRSHLVQRASAASTREQEPEMQRRGSSAGGRSGDAAAMLRRSLMLVALWSLAGGCMEDYKVPYNTGSLGGRVVLSGGVRGASIVVDQLDW